MTQLVWGETGTRLFETGVDRGVLYPPTDGVGVPWNGLTGVSDTPSGGEIQSFYQDGLKYLMFSSAEEYKATITAFSAPREFDQCDGIGSPYSGLSVTNQPRKKFGLSYRTLVGNDTAGEDFGYKLHLIYDAIALPSSRAYLTKSATPEAMSLTWTIEAIPPAVARFKPSAHLVIDSTKADPSHLEAVEELVYGVDLGDDAKLPTVAELIAIFGS